jgi:DNA-binding transcriptional regulator YbjK
MPKIVDHDERRRVIVEALWRVIARDGANEVSVRHVAAEAGMPKSSIGHYVGTMPQLLGLAVDQLVEINTDHIMTLDLLELTVDKVTETLCTLVPVTPEQRHRSGVWLLLIAQAGADQEFAEVLHRLNASVDEGLRELLGGMVRHRNTQDPCPDRRPCCPVHDRLHPSIGSRRQGDPAERGCRSWRALRRARQLVPGRIVRPAGCSRTG